MKPAFITYGIFILVSTVLGVVTYKYLQYITRDVNTKALGNGVVMPRSDLIAPWK